MGSEKDGQRRMRVHQEGRSRRCCRHSHELRRCAPTASLHVPNMHCEFSCVEKVKQVLADQKGVKEVKIDFKTKTATVAIDEAAFDADGAIAALVDFQFMDSELITDQTNTLAGEASTSAEATTIKASFEK